MREDDDDDDDDDDGDDEDVPPPTHVDDDDDVEAPDDRPLIHLDEKPMAQGEVHVPDKPAGPVSPVKMRS